MTTCRCSEQVNLMNLRCEIVAEGENEMESKFKKNYKYSGGNIFWIIFCMAAIPICLWQIEVCWSGDTTFDNVCFILFLVALPINILNVILRVKSGEEIVEKSIEESAY